MGKSQIEETNARNDLLEKPNAKLHCFVVALISEVWLLVRVTE